MENPVGSAAWRLPEMVAFPGASIGSVSCDRSVYVWVDGCQWEAA